MKVIFYTIIILSTLYFANSEKQYKLNKNLLSSFINNRLSAKEKFKLYHYIFQKPYNLNSYFALERYKIFKSNLEMFEEHNKKDLGYKLGITPFADLTMDEFEEYYLNGIDNDMLNSFVEKVNNNPENYKNNFIDENIFNNKFLQNEIDEKNKLSSNTFIKNEYKSLEDDFHSNYVSTDYSYTWKGVKDQLRCNSCWAFSVVGVVESFYYLNYSQHKSFSEQVLMDCNSKVNGCFGGWFDYSYDIIKYSGLPLESEYPYQQKKLSCKKYKTAVKLIGYKFCMTSLGHFKSHFECTDKIINDFLKSGPYTAPIELPRILSYYTEGIIPSDKCKKANHSMIVVYINRKEKYIKVKNSWGPNWGENGYGKYKIEYSVSNSAVNTCFALNFAFQPYGIISYS